MPRSRASVRQIGEILHLKWKLGLCDRRAGVRELWEFATSFAGKETAIIDLQARSGPRSVEVPEVVPGVRAARLDGALQVLREVGGLVEF